VSAAVITLERAAKKYKMFATRREAFVDALGLSRVFRSNGSTKEFWALRDVDLTLRAGERLGVIGRNGAGKTTLLRLVIGAIQPTEGRVIISGRVHALLDAGAGFHPELTGRENTRNSLTLLGLNLHEVAEAEEDVADFTELGEFLDQPIKTYSAGMLARLAFATATAVNPTALVIDEILGAGDAYFINKSTERMQRLVQGGAAVILVSHSLDHITRFCDEALWLERGRIRRRGPALEVVKAYQEFIHVLEDRRLRARNRKVQAGYSEQLRDIYADTLLVRFDLVDGASSCEVSNVTLRRDGVTEDDLHIGDAQDADPTHSSFVVLDGCSWSEPTRADGRPFRSIVPAAGVAGGAVAFALFQFDRDAEYSLDVTVRTRRGSKIAARAWLNGNEIASHVLSSEADEWKTETVALRADSRPPISPNASATDSRRRIRDIRRWPGEGTIRIQSVRLLGQDGKEQAVFRVGSLLTIDVTFVTERDGTFPVIPALVLYRQDGVRISSVIGERMDLQLERAHPVTLQLGWGPLRLGNGYFGFSVALHREMDITASKPSPYYDLLDLRSNEFQVVGTPLLRDGIVLHDAVWRLKAEASPSPNEPV